MEADEDISTVWADLRAKPLRGKVLAPPSLVSYTPPPVEPVFRWTNSFNEETPRPSLMVIPGPTVQDRLQWYQRYPLWVQPKWNWIVDITGADTTSWTRGTIAVGAVVENLTCRISAARVPPAVVQTLPAWFPDSWEWGLLWALAGNPGFIVGEALRTTVNQSHRLEYDFYKALWEFRFTLKENSSFEPGALLFFTITRWMTGAPLSDEDVQALDKIGIKRRVETNSERIRLLLLLVTLAAQNGILNRVVLAFDGLELALNQKQVLHDLDVLLGLVDLWVNSVHTPIGMLVGFNPAEMAQLRDLNQSLAARIEAGLTWAP